MGMDPSFVIEVEALAAALDQLDYFGVLKLPQAAGAAEIKAAYYRESRAYHPDRFAALPDEAFRKLIGKIYRRVNEAYTVLRDDKKRAKYVQDVSGPDRAKKLRFTEADEVQVKEEQKKKIEEQLGQTPNGRKFYAAALVEIQAQRWEPAQRALKSALMYEPANAKFKEQLALVEKELDKTRTRGDQFRIK
jgi:DnaJ-class molecular chaperone